ncbi:MAG TPA: co-chaperone GroES [Deltaproteobacteria bacterium]|nr:MAG: co-chaperone GroES [Deltaproteobacteria bacterium]HDM32309.1 co-chaperone GroES [Deltaproteobacteria bacterium]
MKKLQPINANVLIKLDPEKEEKSPGGIIIPDTAREKSNEGEIVAIAAGASEEISVGDRVIYDDSSSTKIKFEGVEYVIVPASDILAKYVEVDSI